MAFSCQLTNSEWQLPEDPQPACPLCGDEIDPEQDFCVEFCVECCIEHSYMPFEDGARLCRHCGKADPLNHYRAQQKTDSGQGYVVTKVSKAGVRYFFRGETDRLETADGHTIQTARTSLFFGDARVYLDLGLAEADAAYLNLYAVSKVKWTVEPATKLGVQWGIGE